MNKFWEWMKRKGYCTLSQAIDASRKYEKVGRFVEFTKQMLIGYMIEYLMTKYLDDDFDDLMDCCPWDLRNIDNVHMFLEKEIKEQSK